MLFYSVLICFDAKAIYAYIVLLHSSLHITTWCSEVWLNKNHRRAQAHQAEKIKGEQRQKTKKHIKTNHRESGYPGGEIMGEEVHTILQNDTK